MHKILYHIGNSNGNLLEKHTAVDNLKGAVKCSLAQLVDIKTIGTAEEIIQNILLYTRLFK
jgi:hypothetical protein